MKFVPGWDGLQFIHVADWSIQMHRLEISPVQPNPLCIQ